MPCESGERRGVSMVGKCLFGPHLSIKIGFDLQGCRAASRQGWFPKIRVVQKTLPECKFDERENRGCE